VITYFGNSPHHRINPVGSDQYMIVWFESLIESDQNGVGNYFIININNLEK
jgi:hypothetical protein